MSCAYRVRLVRGTGRDGTERGVPSRVWCAKNGWNGLFHGTDFGCFCVPPLPPGTGLFHVCGTQCFTILRQIYPMSFSKITHSFRPVPSRSVPSAYQTHPYYTYYFTTFSFHSEANLANMKKNKRVRETISFHLVGFFVPIQTTIFFFFSNP
ncbi:unnamed protein product [Malus baccata var. baccata]